MTRPHFVLKRAVGVSPDPSRADYEPGQLRVLDAGTALDDIPRSELDQLAPAHFTAADGDDDLLPDDWRSNPDTLAHDKRQERNHRAEAKERARRKADKNAQAEEG